MVFTAPKFSTNNSFMKSEPLRVETLSFCNPTTLGSDYKTNETSNSTYQSSSSRRNDKSRFYSSTVEEYLHSERQKSSKKTTRMYRALVISAMAGAAFGGAIAPQTDISSQQSRQFQLAGPLTNNENSNEGPVYNGPIQQKSPLPSSQYFYPTYPEYQKDPQGFGVQSGFEGYLIPAPQRQTSTWASGMLSSLVPISKFALSYGARATAYLWDVALILLLGAAFITSICTFTPFCTITILGLGISKNQVREQVSELARTYITPESMSTATLLVQKAIDKYAELQRKQREMEEKEQSEKNEKKETKRKRR